MTPHLWKSVLPWHRGQWACSNKHRVKAPASPRVCYPAGEIYYGGTPLEAYNKWKEHNVGRA